MCQQCRTHKVCKVYSMMHDLGIAADIQICPYADFRSSTTNSTGIKSGLSDIRQRSVNDVLYIADKIQEISNESTQDDGVQNIALCERCEREDATQVCFMCGKKICDDCSIESIQTGKTYCEQCYDELEPAHTSM